MKTKALIFLLLGIAASIPSLQAGPTIFIQLGGNRACGPAVVRANPVFFRPNAFCQPTPFFYQPYFATTGFSPTYFSIGPTTVRFNSGTQTESAVSPIVVPPPVILNSPVVVSPGTSFSWKH